MRVGHTTTVSGRAERPFECGSCGYKALLDIVALGEGTQSILNSSGTAERRAERDLARDVGRVASVTRCPVCKHRDSSAVWRWWMPWLLSGVGLSALVSIAAAVYAMKSNMRESDQSIALWICAGLFVFLAAGVLGSAALRWSQIPNRVSFREDPSVAKRYEAD